MKILQDGLYIQSGQHLTEEQRSWPDEDPSKNIDFEEFDYWLTTSDGVTPQPITDISEITEWLDFEQLMQYLLNY